MILITGATGFLGSELIHQLTTQGKHVRALKREHSIIPALLENNKYIEWYTVDLLDLATLEDAFENVIQVYHCAAFVSFDPKDKKRMLAVNIEGTSNIVNLCVINQARLVHVSSVAALGNSKKDKLITEKHFWEYDAKAHSYAISKYEGEMEVWRGITEGLNAVIVNPSLIIGANAGFAGSGAIFKLVKDGLTFYTPGATGLVDVEDVAKSMILLMDSAEQGERFTISAENHYYKTFFEEIAAQFGVKAPSKEAKPWMLGIAWRAAKFASYFTRKPAKLTSDAARSSLNVSLYSNDKIKHITGITFKPLKETIKVTCEALKQI